MQQSITPALPSLPFDVAMHGSSTQDSVLEPITVAVGVIIAVLPT